MAECDALQTKLDEAREVYEYMRQTVPRAWAPIMIVEKLAAVFEEDPYGTPRYDDCDTGAPAHMKRMDALYQLTKVLTSSAPRTWNQGERKALIALFREMLRATDPRATNDQLLDLGYSIDDPEGTKIRQIIQSLPEEEPSY